MKPNSVTASEFNPSAAALSTAELFRRIDEMKMSAQDRERAKATLLAAERISEWLASVFTKLSFPSVRTARPSTHRSALRNSPAPR